ncbi:MAG TPA: hypothetical protein G4O20_00480 [Dehalococcoidia bacterium]|nr:hypothetical protein [Dehalococcoidia bacterium]
MKGFKVFLFVPLILTVLLSSFGCASASENGDALPDSSPAEAEKIARNFLEQSPIYLAYGDKDTLELAWTKKPAVGDGLEFIYQFESSRLGYTCDLTDFMVSSESKYTQVASIVVSGTEITSAKMIGWNHDMEIPERIVWDMLKQEITET